MVAAVALAVLSVVLVACGGAPSPGTAPKDTPLSRELMEGATGAPELLAGMVIGAVFNPGALMGGPIDIPLPAMSVRSNLGIASSVASCLEITGDETDADGDGIPVNLVVTYDCEELGYSQARLADKDDSDPNGGFTVAVKAELAIDELQARMDYAMDVEVVGPARYAVTYDGDYFVAIPDFSVRYGIAFSMDLSGSQEQGVATFDGTFMYSGECGDAELCPSGAVRLSMKGNINYTSICPVDGGSRIELRDSFGNVVVISYTGCYQSTTTYNGEPLDDTVSSGNTCSADGEVDLPARPPELAQAPDSGLVEWIDAPEIDPDTGTLYATGTLAAGAALFNPLDGDGPAFSVHYGDDESLMELVPDPGPGQCWRLPSSGVTVTLATFDELVVEGARFSFAASSPLLRDVGDGELELRVWGTDMAGQPALLGTHSIAVP